MSKELKKAHKDIRAVHDNKKFDLWKKESNNNSKTEKVA